MASRKYPLFVFDVAAALKKRYRDFNHFNLKDTLDELLFIICSTKTGEASYRSTFRSPKTSLPLPAQSNTKSVELVIPSEIRSAQCSHCRKTLYVYNVQTS